MQDPIDAFFKCGPKGVKVVGVLKEAGLHDEANVFAVVDVIKGIVV